MSDWRSHLWAWPGALAMSACAAMACSVLGSSLDRYTEGEASPSEDGAACPAAETQCGGACVDTRTNAAHCGGCDNACPAGGQCTDGACTLADGGAPCPNLETLCGGACVDLGSNAAHCGACGNQCPADKEECRSGKCAVPCKNGQNGPLADPWGATWDGLERAASTHAVAKETCEGFGGRLPTPSELLRVSAVRSATVGQTSHTNPLWSLAPSSANEHVTMKLSDAIAGVDADTETHNYRCFCPGPTPKAYTGKTCYGPATGSCFSLDTEGKRMSLDLEDRPNVRKGVAVWECTFFGGRLATPRQLVEAIQQGIPAGSGAWLLTADDVRSDQGAVLRWTTGAGFVLDHAGADSTISWSGTDVVRPFRCVGVNYAAGAHPAAVPDEHVGARTGFKTEKNDLAARAWIPVHDACTALGGHLPTSTEIAALIADGTPNGSGDFIWSSDVGGLSGSQFLAVVRKWTGLANGQLYDSPADMGWAYKHSANLPHRCIFYPVDTSYQGPAAATCSGGCFKASLGASGAAMWLDATDRAASSLTAAVDACRKIGGHVPTERDLAEAIRKGLPNGSGALLWSIDLERTNPAEGAVTMRAGVVQWAGTDPAFTDQYDTKADLRAATWEDPAKALAYRCLWTNELR